MRDRERRHAQAARRFWEIDLLRGFSVVSMIGFHAAYDLLTFSAGAAPGRQSPSPLDLPLYTVWQRVTAMLFLLLAGISLTLGAARRGTEPDRRGGLGGRFPVFLTRGAKIFAWGLAITAITRLALGRGYVIFGILHLIGLSIVLSYPFRNGRRRNFIGGALVIGVGIFLSRQDFTFPWLLWAGFVPTRFYSVDFFPLFPWFGFILWGIGLGNILYAGGRRRAELPDRPPPALGWLCLLGRNSLAIYLVHQPLLVLLLILWRGPGAFQM